MKIWICTSALGLATGCHPHVSLPAPPPNISGAERVSMFQQYVPVSETQLISCGVGPCQSNEASIELASGLEVFYPEDLQPLVRLDSETTRHIAAWNHAQVWSTWLTRGGLLAVAAGIVYAGASNLSNAGSRDRDAGLLVGVAGFATFLVGSSYGSDASAERLAAYRAFRHDLAARLSVCVAGYAIVPCEAPPAPQPPVVPQAIPWRPPN